MISISINGYCVDCGDPKEVAHFPRCDWCHQERIEEGFYREEGYYE